MRSVAAGRLDAVEPTVPESWEADVVLRDGHTVRIRPIVPSDGPALVRFHERQSPESIYFRFFSPRPRLSERDVEHFTHVDHRDRVAFVAVLGEEIIGVARYERYTGTDTAEVAFFIDDDHHGRGLATLMLEYLAAAGRENGLSRFAASTLPNNRKMLAVFGAAGYDVATHLEDGVIDVAFDIRPTDQVVAAMDRRERVAEAASVRRLFAPRSVAVVGAGSARGGLGAEVVHNLVSHGFTGRLMPVNRDGRDVAGQRATTSVADLPDGVDLVVVAVPAADVLQVVEQCGQQRVGAVVIMSAGFSEEGPDGAERERRVVEAARRHGMRVVGPNSLGLLNTDPSVRLHASPTPASPPAGTVAMLSESGTLAAAILDHAERTGLGFSTFVAAGIPADVSSADLLSYWTDDDATGAVLLYLAARGLPPRFVRAARAASLAKPVAALHTMIHSPTAGRRSESDRRADAVFRQTGVMSVGTLEQLFDIGRVLADQPAPRGRGVAVIGNSDGAVALAADACVGAGLDLVPFGGGTSDAGPTNPVDLSFRATADDYAAAIDVAVSDPSVHSVIVIDASPELEPSDEVARVVLEAARRAVGTTFAATMLGAERATRLVDGAGGVAVPIFPFPEHAAHALGRLARYHEWRSAASVHGGGGPVGCETDRARSIVRAAVDRAGGGGPVTLDHREQEDLLSAYGLRMADRRTVADADAAVAAAQDIGWPVALKARARDRRKRTALGGVGVDIAEPDELRATWARMEGALGAGMTPAVVQRFVEQGVDIAVRVRREPHRAGTVEIGLGGPSTLADHWELGVLPLALPDASALVSASSVGRALTDPLDRVPVVALVHRLAALVDDVDEIHELVANPVVASGAAAWITDVDVVVGAPVGDLAVRRLD